ncbi:MAG: xanthine dehydrogenase family protein molybdopterin-binding subunit [Methanothrix sp.]
MDRLERFVKGMGQYVDDIKVENPLYMAVVRSPYARAKITSIKGGISHSDLDAVLASVGEGAGGASANPAAHPIFANGYANYVGQPIAAVFAEDRYAAEDALEGVDVEYEPLKPVVSPEEAMKFEPIHKGMKSNIISDKMLGKDFELKADIVLEDRLENHRIATNAIETRGILANFVQGRLIVHVSTQSVFSIKRGLCGTLGLPEEKVRVIQADTGGGFGLKGGMQPEHVIAAFAAMKYKRPVKWIETRLEHLMAANQGRGAIGKMKLYAKRSGKILGVKGTIIVDAGAYAEGLAGFAPGFIAHQLTEQYAIENGYVRAVSVLTNKAPYGPYRGAGRPEAGFFMERMVDMLADELGMDDAEIRLLNAADKPFTSPFGMHIDASKPFMEKALKALGYESMKKRNAGIGFFVLVPGAAPGEGVRLEVKSGKLHVWIGSNQHGQGHDFFIKKLVKEELGLGPEDIIIEVPDTDNIKAGIGTWGSRSAMVGGSALVDAARHIKEEITKKHGKYTPKLLLEGDYDYSEFYKFDGEINSFGANLAIAKLGPVNEPEVLEVRACYDVGRALSMEMVKSQIEGGIIQGTGQVIGEEVAYDENGQLLTSSISNAGVVRSTKAPKCVVKIVENPSTLPDKAKGLGEAPTIGTPLAIVRSLEHITGKRIRSTPVRPQDIK